MRAWSRLTQRRPRGQFRVGLGPRQVGWEMEGAPPNLSTESSTEEVAAWTRAQTIDGAAEVAEKFLAEEVDGEVLAACERPTPYSSVPSFSLPRLFP